MKLLQKEEKKYYKNPAKLTLNDFKGDKIVGNIVKTDYHLDKYKKNK